MTEKIEESKESKEIPKTAKSVALNTTIFIFFVITFDGFISLTYPDETHGFFWIFAFASIYFTIYFNIKGVFNARSK